MSVRYQCGILSLNRSSLYYERVGLSEEDHRILDEMDKIYLDFPTYGSRRMSRELKRRGFDVGRQRVRGLMRILGVEAIYPYLLRDVTIDRPDMAWATDITYIRLKHGFVYLVAVMDLFSRYIVSWKISNTLETAFCCEALKEALERKKPEYFNTDQGAQFTSKEFIEKYNAQRLHQSLKEYDTPLEAYLQIKLAVAC